MEKIWAVVPAAGMGKRMGMTVKKQFIQLKGKEILVRTLEALAEVSAIEGILVMVSREDMDVCQELLNEYHIEKVKGILLGGSTRQESVFKGLSALPKDCTMVVIHDGARPFVTQEMLERARLELNSNPAAVAAVPSKDTVKLVDADGYVTATPDRNFVWNVQTPQCFSYPIIKEAYDKLSASEDELQERGVRITDDAMVVETFSGCRVKLFEGDYRNIKITTPDDMEVAEKYLQTL